MARDPQRVQRQASPEERNIIVYWHLRLPRCDIRSAHRVWEPDGNPRESVIEYSYMLRAWAALGEIFLCVPQDDGEIDRLVRQLSNDSAITRNDAESRLGEFGNRALPALQRALSDPDLELRTRVKSVIDTLARLDRERDYDQKQKERILEQRARILGEQKKDEPGTLLKGSVRFAFSASRFQGGLVVNTRTTDLLSEGEAGNVVDFDLSSVLDDQGKEVALERCGRCSPKIILAKDTRGPLRVRVRGSHRWFSRYDVTLKNPKDGDQTTVGNFTIRVDWPTLIVQSKQGFPKEMTGAFSQHFNYDVNPGSLPAPRYLVGGGSGSHSGFFPGQGWCACRGGPVPPAPAPKVELVNEFRVAGGEGHRLDEVKSIEYLFRKPVVEPFDFVVDVPGQ